MLGGAELLLKFSLELRGVSISHEQVFTCQIWTYSNFVWEIYIGLLCILYIAAVPLYGFFSEGSIHTI